MKVITLTQPWAMLATLADRRRYPTATAWKGIETRSWATKYRGPIAIHAARHISVPVLKAACRNTAIREALRSVGLPSISALPRGVILSVGWLTDCRLISPGDEPPEPECYFGNYTPGRFAQFLDGVRALPEPIPARGFQRLWEFDLPEEIWGGATT